MPNLNYESGIVPAAGFVERNLDKILEKVEPFCEFILKNFEGISKKTESISTEFGLGISVEGNLFVVKASGEDTIKVIMNWSLDNNNKSNNL